MSEPHSHGDEGVGWTHASSAWVPVCPECRQSVFGIVSALEAERDELRAALWDLRAWNWEEALALSDPKARRGAFRCQYCGGGSVSDDARRLHEQRCKRRPRG